MRENRRLSRQALSETIMIVHPDGTLSMAVTTDMSRSCVRFTCGSELHRESALELLIPMAARVVRCQGRVVRTEFDKHTASFSTVVAITHTDLAETDNSQVALAT